MRDGTLDITQLFMITSIDDRVAADRALVPVRLLELQAMLAAGVETEEAIGC